MTVTDQKLFVSMKVFFMAWYILTDDSQPVAASYREYLDWLSKRPKHLRTPIGLRIARDEVDGVTINTMFVGSDCHQVGASLMLWETTVFTKHRCKSMRANSCEEALHIHQALCDRYLQRATT